MLHEAQLTADQSTILQSRSATIPHQLKDERNAVCAIRRHGKLKCAVTIVTSGNVLAWLLVVHWKVKVTPTVPDCTSL
jgi:hypothetical protein